MLIRIVDAPAVPGGKAVLLCDDDGNTLPMQQDVVVRNGVDAVSSVTATFAIDGKKVRFE